MLLEIGGGAIALAERRRSTSLSVPGLRSIIGPNPMRRNDQPADSQGSAPENERLEVLDLATDPVLRRAWLVQLAQKSLPFDKAIEWARTAEQFITSSPTTASPTTPSPDAGRSRRSRGSMRDAVLNLIRDNPVGLSRGEILERLRLKGDKTGETAVSNALMVLTKRQEIVRRDRKYLIE